MSTRATIEINDWFHLYRETFDHHPLSGLRLELEEPPIADELLDDWAMAELHRGVDRPSVDVALPLKGLTVDIALPAEVLEAIYQHVKKSK